MVAAAAMTTESPAALALKSFIKRNSPRTAFLEHEVKGLLAEAGIAIPRGIFVPAAEEAGFARLAGHRLSYPLVAKVSSSQIASKSDVRGVMTGIQDFAGLKEAVGRLLEIPAAEGVIVEEMAPAGVEVIVGGVIDRQFGPVVMLGLGGIFVELFRDVAFGLAPLSPEDAMGVIDRVRGSRLLRGYRGKPPADVAALVRIMVALSEMMGTGLIEEIDLNPVAVYPEGALILDAKMKALTP